MTNLVFEFLEIAVLALPPVTVPCLSAFGPEAALAFDASYRDKCEDEASDAHVTALFNTPIDSID